jgi:hypothetical protein
MRVIRWSFLSASVLAVQSPTSAEQTSASPVPAASSAPLTQVIPLYQSTRRSMAMLTLADGPPSPVIFDTGASGNSLSDTYADRLNLKKVDEAVDIDGATGKSATLPVVALPQPELSGVPLMDPIAVKRPTHELDMIGIFGLNNFTGRLVTLELGLTRLRLSDPADAPDGHAFPYLSNADLPGAEIVIAGKPVQAVLDSGNARGFYLPKSMMATLPLKTPPHVVGVATSALGQQTRYVAQLRGDIRVGPLVLHDPEVNFAGESMPNVGNAVLRQLTLVFDPKRQLSWILDPTVDRLPPTSYAGHYGDYLVRANGHAISVQVNNQPALSFTPLGSGLFENPSNGDRVQFHRADSRSVAMSFIPASGQVVSSPRTR